MYNAISVGSILDFHNVEIKLSIARRHDGTIEAFRKNNIKITWHVQGKSTF